MKTLLLISFEKSEVLKRTFNIFLVALILLLSPNRFFAQELSKLKNDQPKRSLNNAKHKPLDQKVNAIFLPGESELWKNEPFGNRDISKELVERRSANEKHFQRADGQVDMLVSSDPINYFESGVWNTIYNTIREESNDQYKFSNYHNVFKSYYAGNIQDGFKTRINNQEIFEMLSASMYYEKNGEKLYQQPISASFGKADQNTLTYSRVYGDLIDLKVTQSGGKRKLDYIIKSKNALDPQFSDADYLVFSEEIVLPDGWSAKLDNGAVLLMNQSGKVVSLYEMPIVLDSNHSKTEKKTTNSSQTDLTNFPAKRVEKDNNHLLLDDNIAYELMLNGNTLTILTKVKMSYLLDEKRVYPIVVDPTLTATVLATTTWWYDYIAPYGPASVATTGAPANSYITNVNLALNVTTTQYPNFWGTWVSYTGNCGAWHVFSLDDGTSLVFTCGGNMSDWNCLDPNRPWRTELWSVDGDDYRARWGFTVTVTYETVSVPTSITGTTTICAGSSTTLTAAGGTANAGSTPITTQWFTGSCGGTLVGTGTSISVTPSTTTTYFVRRVGQCSTTSCASATVTVSTPPTSGTLSGTQAICVGGTTTFSSTVAGGSWTSSNTAVATINASTGAISGVSAGTATMTYTVTGTGGCSNATATRTVTVSTPPTSGTLSGTQAICVGGTTTFSSTVAGGSWTSSNTAVATINASSGAISGVSAGTETMTYTVTGTGGCSNATATRTVTVSANLPASVAVAASPAGTICAGTSVTFTATPTNGGTTPSYQWKVNGTNVGTNSPTFTSAALTNGQAVTCEMTSNATPCLTGSPATSNTVTMTVTPSVAASVSIAATPGTNVCIGTNVTFTATPTNGGTPTYQWKLNGSNVGTNSPTYSNNALTSTSVVTCEMTSTATCATGSPATSNSISGIVPSAPTAVSGTASAVCQVPAGSGWVRFLDGSGRLVVSINPGSNNLGLVTADAYDHGSSVSTQACNTGTNPEWTTAVLGRSWRITPTNNLGASLELPFEDGEMSDLVTASSNTSSNPRDNVSSRGDLKMSRYSGASQNGSWSDNCADGGTSLIGGQLGNGTSPAGIATSQYVQFATPGFSEFWLHGNTTASPLPITLTNFGASCNEKGDVQLNWSTASEQNASHFVIERSRDLMTWDVVSTLPAGGNTTTEQLYALTDVDALGGVSYYRLVQVDFDGESEIYGPIAVTCESIEGNTMTVFPNPTKADFTVEITSTSSVTGATLQLTDLTGKVIASRQVDLVAGKNQLLFSDLDLQMGTYIVQLIATNGFKSVKVVVN